MSENKNRGVRDFSQFDSMDTDKLEELLRQDIDAPDGEESDTELLLYVMEVLANRRKNNNVTGKTALEAWESFQQNYLPDEEECLEYTPKRSERASKPWLRRLIAAAAAIVLVVCIPVTANAFGLEDLWNIFARWAKETFSFVSSEDTEVSEPSPTHKEEFISLQELLINCDRDSDIVPTWIPYGYVLETVEKDITPAQEVYRAFYLNGDKELRIRVQSYIDTDPERIEINEELIEIYESSGVEYYIFSNYEQIRAVWIKDSYECNISGTLTIEEIKSMIDSIGKE